MSNWNEDTLEMFQVTKEIVVDAIQQYSHHYSEEHTSTEKEKKLIEEFGHELADAIATLEPDTKEDK